MKKIILVGILIFLSFSGCYTKLNIKAAITPQNWQESRTRELDHVAGAVECFKWDYYYRYPYWLNLSGTDEEKTGFSRFVWLGGKTVKGLCFAINAVDIFDFFNDNDDDKQCGERKKPEKRNGEKDTEQATNNSGTIRETK